MLVADLIQFLFLYTLASLILRWVQGKMNSTSDTGKALAYLFH